MVYEVTEKDADVFDGLLTEVMAERLDHERRMVEYWMGRIDAAREESRKNEAREKYDSAMDMMRKKLHNEVRWLTSSMVKCDDPGCQSHRALFVGIA